jgi:hypothetical protein
MMKRWFGTILFCCLACAAVKAQPPAASGQQIFKTPNEAAQSLCAAWRAKNRGKAQQSASPEAVDKLFGVKGRLMKFKGCHKREEGDFECLYEDRRIDFTMAFLVEVARRGYSVRSVSFSSEAQ